MHTSVLVPPQFLAANAFVDSDHLRVIEFANRFRSTQGEVASAVAAHLADVSPDRQVTVDLATWRDGDRIPVEEIQDFLQAAIAPSTGEAVVTWSHSLPDGGHAVASVNAP